MNCPIHGYAGSCHACRKASVVAERAMVERGDYIWAVLPWRGDGNYVVNTAFKTFKRKSAAEAYARKLYDECPLSNAVARMVRIV